jgi:ureidoglycolate dehydrogenase (NAD+)
MRVAARGEKGFSVIRVPTDKLQTFCLEALARYDVRPDVANHVATGLVQASLRGVDSHGVRLLPHYLRAVRAGRLNPTPKYRFERTSGGVGLLDGDHTFGHAAGAEGMARAIELAKDNGVGAVAVRNSSHFGAAAYFALMAAEQDMIGFSFTHGDSLVLPTGGRRPFFGANTICLAAPCDHEEPFCADMATSLVTWNKVLQFRDQGGSVPLGWGVDEQGKDTQDVHQIAALHPIGGHKGFSLSMMIEVLCGLLTGMPFGRHIVRMYADPLDKKRRLGHFFMAIRIDSFISLREFKVRMRQMMEEVRHEPSRDEQVPVQVPGDPEKRTKAERGKLGIPLDGVELQSLQDLARQLQIVFPPHN